MGAGSIWLTARNSIIVGLAGSLLALGGINPATAQEKFPSQSIEIVATFGPGGGADLMARKMAQLLEPILGVPVFVSNVAGASGNAGLTKMLLNPPDGYTVATLIAPSVSAWASGIGTVTPDDFTILAVVMDTPSMLFVPADSPFQTFKEFLDYAKANPGKLRVATSGIGTEDDITLKYLASLGYRTVNVPYAKPLERYASPFGKRTHAIYEQPGDVAEFLASKKLRPLVVFDRERHPDFKDVPASKEFGLEISDLYLFRALVVPAKTPPQTVKILADAIDRALASPEWKKFCAENLSCAKKYIPEQAKAYVKKYYETVLAYVDKLSR